MITSLLARALAEAFLHCAFQRADPIKACAYIPWRRLGGRSLNSSVPAGMRRAPADIPIANEVTERPAEKMNGIPLSLLPEAAFNASTTAHILGGCCMGESPDKGVVGYNGEIFGYPNLFVADGSVVPANLGVNPSLTIAALSEYIMSQVPEKSSSKGSE